MNQLDTLSPTLTTPPMPLPKLEAARRLIILVPALEEDYLPAIHRIRELINSRPVNILLLGCCKDFTQEPSLRRDLITMHTMLQDDNVHVDLQVEVGANWVELVKRNYQTGDLVVCFGEQQVGLLHKPVSQILQSNLKVPVYILSSVSTERPKANLWIQAIVWLGSIGIIIGFFMLQSIVIQNFKDWLQSVLLILTLIPEFWLVLFWNGQFG